MHVNDIFKSGTWKKLYHRIFSGEMNYKQIKKIIFVTIKDSKIKSNLYQFHKTYENRPIPVRETELKPEIIIPCFNHGRYLAEALSSIPSGIDITIINDNSTDDTAKHIEKLKSNYKFKLITNNQNLLQHGSVNKAVAQSENNLFFILNADDLFLKNWVDISIRIYSENPSLRLLSGQDYGFIGTAPEEILNYYHNGFDYKNHIHIYKPEQCKDFNHVNSINMGFSGASFLKSAFDFVDGMFPFKERTVSFDDRDLEMRICSFFEIAVLDTPGNLHRNDSTLKLGQYV